MKPALRLLSSLIWTVEVAASAAAQDTYRGMCDASAAVSLGHGHLVVADDESDVLRIYQRGTPMPVGSVDLIDYLKNRKPNGKNDEADIEGAAAVGQRIYWISSHARKGKDGEAAPHRRRFFATEIVTEAGHPTVKAAAGVPYEALLDDLLADARFAPLVAASKLKPEDVDGLNIEGLAASPEGGLLIGFRNPLPQGRALIVPLLNPAEVVDKGARAVFGDLIRLDLGGRGVRSLELVGNELLIAAGPYGPTEASNVRPDFALFSWTGKAAQAPSFVRSLDAGTFRAEALFADEDAKELVLLSDDGDEKVGGADCKDKSVPMEAKSFRSQSIAMPLTAGVAACAVDKKTTYAGAGLLLARRQDLSASALMGLFKVPLAVNTDGAPTSYHPDDYKGERLAINHLDNGIVIKAASGAPLNLTERVKVFELWHQSGDWTVPTGFTITWKNVIASDKGKPCIFKQMNAGYFGSLTALKNGLTASAAGECGANDQLDQRLVPSLVLRGQSNPLREWGAALGDLVLAINPKTGVMVPAIIGDTGDEKRLGEGSVALNLGLLTGAHMPTTYKQAVSLDTGADRIVVAVLPNSRQFQRIRPYTRENIAQRVQAWAETHGYASLPGLGAAALQCTSAL